MTLREIAGMIDHAVLHPTQTESDLELGCAIADQWQVGAICVKPYHVLRATTLLTGSSVPVCSVIGFPHGNNTRIVKTLETVRALDDGASEIDMVVNIGMVREGNWSYVHDEIAEIHAVCTARNALLKVIFETAFFPNDDMKIRLCEICTAIGVPYVKTSTGFGFVGDQDGKYQYKGATEHDVRLMRTHCGPDVHIKASGGIRTLDDVLFFRELGATRIGTSSTVRILEEAQARFG